MPQLNFLLEVKMSINKLTLEIMQELREKGFNAYLSDLSKITVPTFLVKKPSNKSMDADKNLSDKAT